MERKSCQEYSSDMALISRWIWKGGIWVADSEELGNLDTSESRAPRLKAKEVLTSKKGEIFILPIADGTAKLFGRDHDIRESTPKRDQLVRENFKATRRGLNRQKQKMMLKPETTSGQRKETSFIVITLNLEFRSTCRKKNHSQFH